MRINLYKRYYIGGRNKEIREEIKKLKQVFAAMRCRCLKSTSNQYRYYNGKGISISQEWLRNPDSFIDWALDNGYKIGLEIDRINNKGGYSLENCRFVDRRTQIRNRSCTVTFFEKHTRICYICKKEKDYSCYHRSRNKINYGHHRICKECRKIYDHMRRTKLSQLEKEGLPQIVHLKQLSHYVLSKQQKKI